MPKVKCPIPGCTYETDDLDAAIVAALITAHTTTHSQGLATLAKVEKVKRPVISVAGTSEEWSYSESRWADYVDATRVTGRNKVVQLLECCDEQLRRVCMPWSGDKRNLTFLELSLHLRVRKQTISTVEKIFLSLSDKETALKHQIPLLPKTYKLI